MAYPGLVILALMGDKSDMGDDNTRRPKLASGKNPDAFMADNLMVWNWIEVYLTVLGCPVL